MTALPWIERSPIEPDRDYLVMTSKLPLRTYRSVPAFLRDTMRIRRQLAEAPGLVGYALNAQLLRKTFWTFSVWADQESLQAFAAADPHATIVRRVRPRMQETSFTFATMRGTDVPTNWRARMAGARDHVSS